MKRKAKSVEQMLHELWKNGNRVILDPEWGDVIVYKPPVKGEARGFRAKDPVKDWRKSLREVVAQLDAALIKDKQTGKTKVISKGKVIGKQG